MSAIPFRVLPRRPISEEKRKAQRNKHLLIAAFFLPGFALLFLLLIMPVFQAGYYSFYRWNGLGPIEEFVGFANYTRAFEHAVFRKAMLHNFYVILMTLAVELPLAMFLALMLVRGKLRFQRVFRAVFFLPYVFSEIITGLIWRFVLNPGDGFINVMLRTLIPGFENKAWLGETSLVLPAVFVVMTWKYFGLHMLLYMAAMQNISRDVEDAARIDGASEGQLLRYVTLPMISDTIRLTVFLGILGSLQVFVIILVMTGGGPVYASEVMVTYLYKFGLQRFALGYGAAVSVVLFVIALIFSVGYQRTMMRTSLE